MDHSSLKNFNVLNAYLRVLSFEFLKFRILKILAFHPCGCNFSALENMSAVKEQQKKFTTYSSDFSKRLAHHLNNLFIHQVMYSKTCLKWPLKNRQNKDLNGKW